MSIVTRTVRVSTDVAEDLSLRMAFARVVEERLRDQSPREIARELMRVSIDFAVPDLPEGIEDTREPDTRAPLERFEDLLAAFTSGMVGAGWPHPEDADLAIVRQIAQAAWRRGGAEPLV